MSRWNVSNVTDMTGAADFDFTTDISNVLLWWNTGRVLNDHRATEFRGSTGGKRCGPNHNKHWKGTGLYDVKLTVDGTEVDWVGNSGILY